MRCLQRNLFRTDHLFQRNSLQCLFAQLRILILNLPTQAGVDATRCEFIDKNSMGRQLQRQAAAQHAQASLGNAVSGNVRVNMIGSPASDEQHLTGFSARDQTFCRRLGEMESTIQIYP